MTFTKTLVLLVSLSLVSTACAKKKSARRAPPATSAAPNKTLTDERLRQAEEDERRLRRQGGNADDAEAGAAAEADADAQAAAADDANAESASAAESEAQARRERFAQAEELKRKNADPRTQKDAGNESGEEREEGDEYTEEERAAMRGESPNLDIGKSEPSTGRSEQDECGAAYRRDVKELFYPGTPMKPAEKPRCNFGSVGDVSEAEIAQCKLLPVSKDNAQVGFLYTDARQDDLIYNIVDRANKVPAHIDIPSRDLSKRIRNVNLQFRQGSVEAEVVLLMGRKKYEKFVMKGGLGRSRHDIQLSTATVGEIRLNGVIACTDADGGCSSATIRLQRVRKNGKISAVAFIVYRSGDAHVTIPEKERTQPRSFQNQGHATFAQFMSNAGHNACVALMRDAYAGRRGLDKCAVKRLSEICGSNGQMRAPVSKPFTLRSWSVAYGRAGFDFNMDNQLSIRGPLVIAAEPPMWKPKACIEGKRANGNCGLHVSGPMAEGLEDVLLIMNDGGGNLNFQLDFVGKSDTRITVTSILKDTSLDRARQMSAVRAGDFVDQRDMGDRPQQQEQPGAQPQVRTQAPAFGARGRVAVKPKADAKVQGGDKKVLEKKVAPPKADKKPVAAGKGDLKKPVTTKEAEQKAAEQKAAAQKRKVEDVVRTVEEPKAEEAVKQGDAANANANADADADAQAETKSETETAKTAAEKETATTTAPAVQKSQEQTRIDKDSPVRVRPAGQQAKKLGKK